MNFGSDPGGTTFDTLTGADLGSGHQFESQYNAGNVTLVVA